MTTETTDTPETDTPEPAPRPQVTPQPRPALRLLGSDDAPTCEDGVCHL
ncbi:hypothetical protein IAG44_04115 [Streptomyces roseirectus]|uniref:Uncharacterized protein n=1 Tax=Streptomyces roseirectus TaxID=2768066 RepID=A0A7H0I7F7_9ACTN|nr:hypothetical protein [Streptomyces roseirectus]QNP68723.1 hypothetical protein IAG44_04115 [Streptomyces roseirectus]